MPKPIFLRVDNVPAEFVPLTVQNHAMSRPAVKRIKLPRKFFYAVVGRREIIQIRNGLANLPITRVSFVIADYRCERHCRQKIFNLRQPIFPLNAIFTIVDKIADVHKKIRVAIILEGMTRHLTPRIIAAATLRIGKNYRLELIARNIFQLMPSSRRVTVNNPVFVANFNLRRVLNIFLAVISEARILRGKSFDFTAAFDFDDGIFQRLFNLPHYTSRS